MYCHSLCLFTRLGRAVGDKHLELHCFGWFAPGWGTCHGRSGFTLHCVTCWVLLYAVIFMHQLSTVLVFSVPWPSIACYFEVLLPRCNAPAFQWQAEALAQSEMGLALRITTIPPWVLWKDDTEIWGAETAITHVFGPGQVISHAPKEDGYGHGLRAVFRHLDGALGRSMAVVCCKSKWTQWTGFKSKCQVEVSSSKKQTVRNCWESILLHRGPTSCQMSRSKFSTRPQQNSTRA